MLENKNMEYMKFYFSVVNNDKYSKSDSDLWINDI